MSASEPVLPQYEWIFVCCILAAIFLGLGVGANDVGNSFATVVGSRTLSLRTAILLAVIFELLGSFLLGRTITGTIQGGIADINAYIRDPEVFAYGMLCAVTTTGVWQLVAQWYELNVASGQSLIGSIIGFSLVAAGKDSIIWITPDPKSIPPYKGMVPIVLTWFFSPILTALASALLFWTIRFVVLRRPNAAKRAFWVLPPAVILTFFICIYFVLTKGAKKYIISQNPSWTDGQSAWVSAAAAGGAGLLTALAVLPLLRWMHGKKFTEDGEVIIATTDGDAEKGTSVKGSPISEVALKLEVEVKSSPEKADDDVTTGTDGSKTEDTNSMPWWKRSAKRVWFLATYGLYADVHASIQTDEDVAKVHANAELFDSKAEHVFTYLQVFSAMCVMFAHGAGEVGYMAAPITVCWQMYTEGIITKNVDAPIWATAVGAVSMCIGLVLLGYKMMSAMGVRLARISPSRGFCAELSTALITLIASQWGLPTGGSQCIVGAIVGVGLLEANLNGVNWKFFIKQFAAWVVTIFLMGISCAALFAQGYYSPGKVAGSANIYYEDAISASSAAMFDNYRSVLLTYRSPAASGSLPKLNESALLTQAALLKKMSDNVKALAGTKIQSVEAAVMVKYLHQALALYQAETILTIGQTRVIPGAIECNNNVTVSLGGNATTVACPSPVLLPKGVKATPFKV